MKKITIVLMTIAILFSVVSFASADTKHHERSGRPICHDQLEDFPDNETFLCIWDTGIHSGSTDIWFPNSKPMTAARSRPNSSSRRNSRARMSFQSDLKARTAQYFWYNFFYNETGSQSGASGSTYNNLGKGVPTILLVKMVQGQYMDVTTKYFPEGERWAILLNSGHGAKINQGWIEVKGFEFR